MTDTHWCLVSLASTYALLFSTLTEDDPEINSNRRIVDIYIDSLDSTLSFFHLLLRVIRILMGTGKSMCISEGHGGAGLACGPASAHCILSKS